MEQGCGDQCAGGPAGRMVELKDAVGLVLAHDITEIVPGRSKGPAYRKGHVVGPDDLDHLARLGKNHLYVLEMADNQMHENEAAELMAQALSGPGVIPAGPPAEGKVNLMAEHDGLLAIDVERLVEFNLVPEVMCATIHRHTPVRAGHLVAGTRAIPLLPERDNILKAVEVAERDGGLLRVLPMAARRVGLVVTGNEVASGLIQDRFAPIVTGKVEALGSSILGVRICPDDRFTVATAIKDLLAQGAEMIITTAGMSVDPDDVTRMAIADAGGHDLLYGTPVLPGAMFLVGKLDGPHGLVPVLGVPACALFHQATILDAVLPRVLAGEEFTRRKLAELAHGGFCQNCPEGCRFPICGFARGS